MSAVAIPARRRPEPPDRRSHQPVRRDSRLDGVWTEGFWRPMTWAAKHELLRALKGYDRAKKKPGDRQGPIGFIGLALAEELATMAVNFRGRVRPTLGELARRLAVSRSALVDAMKRLAQVKVLEWVRRLVFADGEWARGQRVQQTSNVYRVALPKALRRYLRKPPPPADDAARRADMRAAIDAALKAEADARLEPALERLRGAVEARKAALAPATPASSIDRLKPSRS